MKRLFTDTLARRLFLLMWATLLLSHFAAWFVVTSQYFNAPIHIAQMPPIPTLPSLPSLPSLPPGPGMPEREAAPPQPPPPPHAQSRPPGGPPALNHDQVRGPGPPGKQGPGNRSGSGPHGLPLPALLLDYGIRLLLIGLAAWWGARWLAVPMRQLARAAQGLKGALGSHAARIELDEEVGTVEVRDTARIFNRMADELDEQFASRGLMIAAISHDLRTPLTRIRMRLESMTDDPLVQRSIADVQEMSALIESTLETFQATQSTEALQDTDVFALVQSIADDRIEQGQAVTLDGSSVITPARPLALRRVVDNLIDNALRYGSKADLRVESSPLEARISVVDAGPGIPPDELEAVFKPWYRLDRSRNRASGGTGLGLYIARDLVRKQGGELRLRNRAGGGLEAEIVLPRQARSS